MYGNIFLQVRVSKTGLTIQLANTTQLKTFFLISLFEKQIGGRFSEWLSLCGVMRKVGRQATASQRAKSHHFALTELLQSPTFPQWLCAMYLSKSVDLPTHPNMSRLDQNRTTSTASTETEKPEIPPVHCANILYSRFKKKKNSEESWLFIKPLDPRCAQLINYDYERASAPSHFHWQ